MSWIDFFIGKELVGTLHYATCSWDVLIHKAMLNKEHFKADNCVMYANGQYRYFNL